MERQIKSCKFTFPVAKGETLLNTWNWLGCRAQRHGCGGKPDSWSCKTDPETPGMSCLRDYRCFSGQKMVCSQINKGKKIENLPRARAPTLWRQDQAVIAPLLPVTWSSSVRSGEGRRSPLRQWSPCSRVLCDYCETRCSVVLNSHSRATDPLLYSPFSICSRSLQMCLFVCLFLFHFVCSCCCCCFFFHQTLKINFLKLEREEKYWRINPS